MKRNHFLQTIIRRPFPRLFAAAVGLVVHTHGAETSFAIATTFRGLARRTRNLAGLLNPHPARYDFTGIGSFSQQQRQRRHDRNLSLLQDILLNRRRRDLRRRPIQANFFRRHRRTETTSTSISRRRPLPTIRCNKPIVMYHLPFGRAVA